MTSYEMVFIITDCEMRESPDVDGEIQIVRIANMTPDMWNDYVPFNSFAMVGELDEFGRTVQSIEGDKKSVAIKGVSMVGILPMPWETIYTVGENFTAEGIVEVNEDGSGKREGFATISRLICGKTKNNTEEIVNYFAEVNASHGRPVMYAEESNPDSPNFNPYGDYSDEPPAATQAAEDEAEFFGAEYEQHLAEVYQSLLPIHRNYEANV